MDSILFVSVVLLNSEVDLKAPKRSQAD